MTTELFIKYFCNIKKNISRVVWHLVLIVLSNWSSKCWLY